MVDIGLFMKLYSYPVSRIFSHDWAPLIFYIFRDLISDIPEEIPWSYLCDPDIPGFFRDSDELMGFLTHFSYHIHPTRITEISIDDRRHVDIQNIPLFQNLISSWHSVTDDIIDRYTGTSFIGFCWFPPLIGSLIVDTCGYSPIFQDKCVHDSIELERTHAWLHILSDHVERLCSEVSRLSYTGYLFGSFYEDFWHFELFGKKHLQYRKKSIICKYWH